MNTLVESEVPFGRSLYTWLFLNDLHLNQLVRHDSREKHFLAWETVRKQTNPFFLEGTGFEGYLVGRCATPDAALDAIVSINQNILDAIARLYRFQSSLRAKLMKTLVRESSEPEAIHIWSAYLGAELGKLRAQMLQNPEAQGFQNQTYNSIRSLPPMVFHEIQDDVTQTYAIGSSGNNRGKLAINLQILKPSQQDAWLVAQNIGQFGHPLVRRFLDRG